MASVPTDRDRAGAAPRSPASFARKHLATVSVLLVVVLVGTAGWVAYGRRFQRWADGTTHGSWLSIYDGYGANGVRSGVISLSPKVSHRPNETHAALVVSTARYGTVDYRVQLQTVRQLRPRSPNPWEIAWIIWGYTDRVHFYYFALKPNGWELGKEDPAYPGNQRFLATGATPHFPIGRWIGVRIEQQASATVVIVDGRLVIRYVDTEHGYRAGRVGLYVEDAHALFRSIKVNP